MGSPSSEPERKFDEPQHQVVIKKPFYMGSYEVTIGQWRQFVNATGYRTVAEKTGVGGDGLDPTTGEMKVIQGASWRSPRNTLAHSENHPVTQVSWNDAYAFINWLGKQDGKTYRLPTEAEWEYAARAGTRTRFSSGESLRSLQGYANISDLTRKQAFNSTETEGYAPFQDGNANIASVGSYRANNFGLFDMHGNVWEWCYDTYDASFYNNSRLENPFSNNNSGLRILRGGCYY